MLIFSEYYRKIIKNMRKRIIYLLLLLSLFLPLSSRADMSNNKLYKDQWYMVSIECLPWVMSSLKRGEGTIVAIIDSGVWLQHPDLIGATWRNSKEVEDNGKDDDNNGYGDDVYGWNFIDNNNDLTSKTEHGTAVAGIVAAQDNDIGIVGIAPKTKIMSLIACSEDGCPRDAVKNAIKYAVDNGAKVINLSLGSSGYIGYTHEYDNVIDYAYRNGVFVVASAGNGDVESAGATGQDLSFSKVSPANNDVNGENTIWGVGATTKNRQHTPWSNYGPGVDSWAPGEIIATLTVPIYSDGYFYSYFNGTSFSAPVVAATAALLFSNYPTISVKQIQDRLSKEPILDLQNIFGQQEPIYTPGSNCPNHSSYINNLCVCDNGYELNSDRNACLEKSVPDNKVVTKNCQENASLINGSCVCGTGYEDRNNICVLKITNVIEQKIKDENNLTPLIDKKLVNRLKGKIVLQIENNGEAWYINPRDGIRYYMANGEKAYNVMRHFSIGITNKDLDKIKVNKNFSKKFSGKIFLQVESRGEAYYIDFNGVAHYLKDGAAAYEIMRSLGLGITNNDLNKIPEGNL